jgi:antitoxin component YwqK of YwqJK toxin-antitoxin module
MTLFNLLHTNKQGGDIFQRYKHKFEKWYSYPILKDVTKYHVYTLYRSGKIVEKRYYYENNKLKKVDNYINNLLNGESIYYDDNGYIICIKNYKNGKQNGNQLIYDNDVLIMKSEYKDDKLNGIVEEFYKDSKRLKMKSTYKDGLIVGWKTSFYEDGSLKSICWYNRNGEVNGSYKELFPSGSLKIEGFYVEGKRQGNFIYYKDSIKINDVFKLEIYKDDILIESL